MKKNLSGLFAVVIFAVLALPGSAEARKRHVRKAAATRAPAPAPVPAAAETLDERIARVMPTETEEAWRSVGWRTNLMEARALAQEQKRPVFLWIIVGNPHGCT